MLNDESKGNDIKYYCYRPPQFYHALQSVNFDRMGFSGLKFNTVRTLLFSRLKTDAWKKQKSIEEKKFTFCEGFFAVTRRSWHGMKWKENFGMEYGRCQNGMEDSKNGIENNLQYFHANSILDFDQGIHRKVYTDSDNQKAFSS